MAVDHVREVLAEFLPEHMFTFTARHTVDCFVQVTMTLDAWELADLLRDMRDTVLREAAATIRGWHDRLPGEHECCDGNAADLIDPDRKAAT